MKKWKVIITPEFEIDLKNIYTYVAEKLQVPNVAKNLTRKILNQIEQLDEMPYRCSLYEKEPWHSRGLRKLIIDNYIVFYLPNEKTNEVIILRVFYSGSNIENLIK